MERGQHPGQEVMFCWRSEIREDPVDLSQR